jgi:2-dehydropantoate 2-reductase
MRIVVFGAGGVGGYFGARLARGGEDVAWVARGEHLRAMLAEGLRVSSPLGDFHLPRVDASDDPARLGKADAVLLAVKAWQVPEAARSLDPLLGEETFVVPLENGVEAAQQVAAAIGERRVLGGLCRIISQLDGPGRVRHGGVEPQVLFGELDRRPSVRGERLRRSFVQAGVRAEIPPDIHVAIWEKFLFIAATSALGAVTRAPVGVVRRLPETRDLLVRAMAEVRELALARGVELPADALPRTLAFLDALPPGGTSSMQRDVEAGRPSELEAQSGAIVRLGREAGIATPVHALLHAVLLPLERRARGELDFGV